jgi:hypothetical protein
MLSPELASTRPTGHAFAANGQQIKARCPWCTDENVNKVHYRVLIIMVRVRVRVRFRVQLDHLVHVLFSAPWCTEENVNKVVKLHPNPDPNPNP